MKLLTTIAAVLISISAFSQDLIEYDNGTFTQNGEELSMEQIGVLTLQNKAGRGNFRRGNRFIRFHKNQNYRIANNTGSFVVGSATGFYGSVSLLAGGLLVSFWEEVTLEAFNYAAAGAGLCVVSYKAFSRIALSPAGCLRKRDKEFSKVADKLNEAIKASKQ